MAKQPKYSGFTSYLANHEFTPEFIHDYKYWCWKIYKRWTLFTDFDNFYSICWEALLSKIDEFDPTIATIQTFCISRINNEAWRFYMANKTQSKRPEIDSDDPVIQSDLVARSDTEMFEIFSDFEKYANSLGVKVNLNELYAQYIETVRHEKNGNSERTVIEETAPMIAFAAWRAMNRDVLGRNDIIKKRKDGASNGIQQG